VRGICILGCVAALAAVVAGCGDRRAAVLEQCPGRGSAAEALAELKSRAAKARPFRANGRCLLVYHTEDQHKPHKESFAVKLWVNPPVEIYIQGDIAFDPRGLVAGANAEEFWLLVRPKDVSSYWWGKWSENGRAEGLVLSPQIVLESLGVNFADIGGDELQRCTLWRQGPFDVLMLHNEQEKVVKALYVYCCDYSVRKIEYFDTHGKVQVVAELEDYVPVEEGFVVPRRIRLERRGGRQGDSVEITLTSVKVVELSDRQRERLFSRPEARGFEHIYKVVKDRWIEQ